MFGHLKAEDFVNLMEGSESSARQKAHLDVCARCRSTWESVRSLHAEVTAMESDVPEPDWVQFRSSVRDELLSRSIQRESAVRRWTGWSLRPASAWALSILLAIGITTVTVLWNVDRESSSPTATFETPVLDPAAEVIDAVPDRGLFDDVVSLGEEQQEELRQMLEIDQKGPASR